MKAKLKLQVGGYFTVEKRKRGERCFIRFSCADFPNLVTDWGLNRIGDNNDWLDTCHVGSSSSSPSVTDTTLGSLVASTAFAPQSRGTAGSEPYYTWIRKTFTFNAGEATGNLSEVGVGINSTTGDYLFSRALIVDGNGDPTTITVLADEELRVTYECRIYLPTSDNTGNVDISGTTYSYTCRAANATLNNQSIGWYIQNDGSSAGYAWGSSSFAAYQDGTSLAAITGSPSGTSDESDNVSALAYVDGSLERSFEAFFGTADANLSGGIGAFTFQLWVGYFQMSVSPSLDKNNQKELTIEVTHAWGRYGSA